MCSDGEHMKGATSTTAAYEEELNADSKLQSSGFKLVEQPVGSSPRPAEHLTRQGEWWHGEDSSAGVRVSIVEERSGKAIATALVTPAEQSTTLARFKLPVAALSRCVFVSDVWLDGGVDGALPAVLYAALRRGRIWDRAVVCTMALDESSHDPKSAARLCDLRPLPKLPTVETGRAKWIPSAQRVDIAIHRVWTEGARFQAFHSEQFEAEAVETLQRWIDRFFKSPWFESIRNGTLTKEQYVYCLSNQHQFVRWTTRLIGRAVSCSHDRLMRNKWLDHLQGEINHEVIIEKDLAGLGEDVDYVVGAMQPIVPNLQFMVGQESAIAFHEDPVLFIASPFVAEGFTARLDKEFIEILRSNAKSWGIENPKHVTAFWASHVEYDGGDDGHWDHSRRVLRIYLKTERDLQRFLNAQRLACEAFLRSYTAYIEDLAIFAASPSVGP